MSRLVSFLGGMLGFFQKPKPETPPAVEVEAEVQLEVEQSPHLARIREQMEFYLSPSNVESQSFMKQLINARDDRYCPFNTFLTFNRLKELGATMEDLVAACSASSDLEVDPTKTMVRTVVPFASDPRRDYRTIHISGLGPDETLDSLQKLFRSIFTRVLRIEMSCLLARGGGRVFKGDVNVELDSEDAANAAVEHGIEHRGQRLSVMLLPAFMADARPGAAKGKRNKAKRAPKRSDPG
jgi:lupus La protein